MKWPNRFCIIFAVINMNRLRELRLEKGIKQEDLAGRLKVRRQTVSRYETGNLDLDTDTIAIICGIFECTADYLLGLSSQRTAQISDEDAALVEAYHAARPEVQRAIDALLQPLKEVGKSSALSDGQEGERHG